MGLKRELDRERKVDALLRRSLPGYWTASEEARKLVEQNYPPEKAVEIIRSKVQTIHAMHLWQHLKTPDPTFDRHKEKKMNQYGDVIANTPERVTRILHTKTHACDLISRRVAIEAICEDCRGIKPKECEYSGKCASLRVIRSIQSADRPKGEWKEIAIRVDGHGEIYYQHDCCCEIYKSQYNFCPNCGAKMEVNHE